MTREVNCRAIDILKNHNIGVTQGFIFFDHRMKKQDILDNFEYIKNYSYGLNLAKLYSRLIVYHGTPLWNEILQAQEQIQNASNMYEMIPPFEDSEVERIFLWVEGTLNWGISLYNLIETLWYSYYMDPESKVNKMQLEQFESKIREKMLQVMHHAITINESNKFEPYKEEFIEYVLEKNNVAVSMFRGIFK